MLPNLHIKINSHLLLYILATFITLYLLICIIIRHKLHFWHTQPVFHLYNLKYWLKPPGLINSEPPQVNKYVNLLNIKMLEVSAGASGQGAAGTSAAGTSAAGTSAAGTADIKQRQICHFIRDNYVIHKTAKYRPTEEDILAYLQNTNHTSYFNVYHEPRMLFEGSEPAILADDEIIGVASARVLNVTLPKAKFLTYYVDHLCVKPGHRKKGIAPQLIQTYYYSGARVIPKVKTYLFKREGELTAIMPLVYYMSHAFDITFFRTDLLLTPAIAVIEIAVAQLNVLLDFLTTQKKRFECVVLLDISSLMNLIKLKKLRIYALLQNGECLACYVFRPLELYYGEKKTVECVAIVSNCREQEVLAAGFNQSLLRLKREIKADILLLEETADSEPVIKELQRNQTVLYQFQSPTAFYLYNYACYSVKKEKTLLLY